MQSRITSKIYGDEMNQLAVLECELAASFLSTICASQLTHIQLVIFISFQLHKIDFIFFIASDGKMSDEYFTVLSGTNSYFLLIN